VAKSKNDLDISVLIATYNRAEILRQTLQSMTKLNRDGLSVEFVVVDNNSSDHTKEVIESFTDRLPIRYLFESRPGKNCALNKALNEVPLGKLVAFTDDDVEPQKDWLKAIIAITNRWPDYGAFGGQSYPIWPNEEIPGWARRRWIQSSCFGFHDYSEHDTPYSPGSYPFGVNYWIRREIFSEGRRYNDAFGPHPASNFLMGSEVSLLQQLTIDGYGIMYSPDAVVGHRFQPEMLSEKYIKKRSYRLGRGRAHWGNLEPTTLFNKHPNIWLFLRLGSLMKALAHYARALLSISHNRRIEREFYAIGKIAYNIESLRLTSRKRRSN